MQFAPWLLPWFPSPLMPFSNSQVTDSKNSCDSCTIFISVELLFHTADHSPKSNSKVRDAWRVFKEEDRMSVRIWEWLFLHPHSNYSTLGWLELGNFITPLKLYCFYLEMPAYKLGHTDTFRLYKIKGSLLNLELAQRVFVIWKYFGN